MDNISTVTAIITSTDGEVFEVEIDLQTRLIVGCIYILLIFGGLGAYAVVILGFRLDRKVYKKQPFYTLVYHLAAGDVGMMVAQTIMLPIVFTGDALYGMGNFHHALGVVETLSFFIVFFTSFLMAINRFCVFMLKPNHWLTDLIFDRHITLVATLPWWFAMLISISTTGIGCLIVFTNVGMYYTHICPTQMTWFGVHFVAYRIRMEAAVPLLMFLMYVLVLVRVKAKRQKKVSPAASTRTQRQHEQRREQREWKLLIQSVIICTVLEVEVLSFNLVPGMNLGFWSGVFLNSFVIINSTINPYIFLLFNRTIRTSVRKVLGLEKQSVAPQPAVAGQ